MLRRCVLVLSCLVFLSFGDPSAISSAQEEGGLAAALAEAHSLIARRNWRDAVSAYQALFANHQGAPEIIARIREIEDDLKLALFMREFEPLENKLLFGPELVKFSKTSLALTLKCKGGPSGPNWVDLKNEWFLNLRFTNRLTVEFETSTHSIDSPFIFYFCFDAQDRSGYAVVPGGRVGSRSFGQSIIRINSGRPNRLEGSSRYGPDPGKYKVVRDSASIRLYEGRKMVLKAKDKKYTSGMLGFSAVFPYETTIKGKLDRDFYQQMRGKLRDGMFRIWEKEEWSQEDHLPAWALRNVAVTDAPTMTALPADAKGLDPLKTGWLIESVLNGEKASFSKIAHLATLQTGSTRLWLRAILLTGTKQMVMAVEELDRLIARDPDFASAFALRGFIRIGLRHVDLAATDLEIALKRDPGNSLAYLGQVLLAVYAGDLAGAGQVIETAREKGALTKNLQAFEDRLHKVSRGPNWPQRHDHGTPHFVIASDHSKDLCREVGDLLESQIRSLKKQFPGVERSETKTRVYIFSSRAGFLGYASDRLKNLSQAAGAYDPRMREVVLFVPVKRQGFVHTVRHEGVHCYMHEFLDDAPMWFSEGLAEYFGSGRLRHGALYRPGALHERALDTLRGRRGKTYSLEELFVLPRMEFMKDPALTYAQSWALVHFLLKTRDPLLRTMLRSYFKLLRDGRSEEEAYARIFQPRLKAIGDAYVRHIDKARKTLRGY